MKKIILQNFYFLLSFIVSFSLTNEIHSQDYQKYIYSDWANPSGNYTTYVSSGCGFLGLGSCNGDEGPISNSAAVADSDMGNYTSISEPTISLGANMQVSAKLTQESCLGDYAGFVYDNSAGLASVPIFPTVTLTAKHNGTEVGSKVFASLLDLGVVESDLGHLELAFNPDAIFDEVVIRVDFAVGVSLGGTYQFFHAFAAKTAPVAGSDVFSINACGVADMTLDVMANDYSTSCVFDLDPATVGIIDEPSNGGAVANLDGTITYEPRGRAEGTDSFTYRICDNSLPLNTTTLLSNFSSPAGNVSSAVGGLICLGCSVSDEENAVDADLDNFASAQMGVGVGGNVSLRAKVDGTATAGDCAGFVLGDGGGLGDVSLLSNIILRTYLGGVLQEESVSGGLLGIKILGIGSEKYEVKFITKNEFDEVEIEIGGLVSGIATYMIYNAFAKPCSQINCALGEVAVTSSVCCAYCPPTTSSDSFVIDNVCQDSIALIDPTVDDTPSVLPNSNIGHVLILDGPYNGVTFINDDLSLDYIPQREGPDSITISVCTSAPGRLNEPDSFSDWGTPTGHVLTETSSLCLGCTVTDPDFIGDSLLTNAAAVAMPVAVAGASVTIKADLNGIGAPESCAGFVLDTDGVLIDLELLSVFKITTYYLGEEQESAYSGGLLDLNLLGLDDGTYEIGFTTTMPFDQVELEIGALVGLLVNYNVYYAYSKFCNIDPRYCSTSQVLLDVTFPDGDGDGLQDCTDPDPVDPCIPYNVGPKCTDTDNDGLTDDVDMDDDNDGIPDLDEGELDHDSDGIPNYHDLDSDNDGILDVVEGGNGNLDTNFDGLIDHRDGSFEDQNNDGQADASVDTLETPDFDGDNVPDFLDLDSDNDGIADLTEGGNFQFDVDNDGVVDGFDLDNDGIIDFVDADGLSFGHGVAGYTAVLDTDSDGDPNYLDLDSDNDGVPDIIESDNMLLDTNNNGTIDENDSGYGDQDMDGIPDVIDSTPTAFGDGNLLSPNPRIPNTDSDPVPNFMDLDSDNDGIYDAVEGGATDVDLDGQADPGTYTSYPLPDKDNDQVPDVMDTYDNLYDIFDLMAFLGNHLDSNFDGEIDGIDSDGDGILDLIDPSPLFGGGATIDQSDEDASIYGLVIVHSSADNNGDNMPDGENAIWLGSFLSLEADTMSDSSLDLYDDGLSGWPTKIVPNNTYTIGITANSNEPKLVHYGLWIDWNEDGSFEDFYTGTIQTASPVTENVDITAPSDAASTSVTRLRVDDEPINQSESAGVFGNGEVEDSRFTQVLPLELESFTATNKECQAKLEWVTANEVDFSHFIIEKSLDGRKFEQQQVVKSRGEIEGSTYGFVDAELRGTAYYRLIMVDKDGTAVKSNTVVINSDCYIDELYAYPNPLVDGEVITVELTSRKGLGESRLVVYDVVGQAVRHQNETIEKGINGFEVNLGGLSTGTYFIMINGVDWKENIPYKTTVMYVE